MSSGLPVPPYAPVLPARHAYSHCASVGNASPCPAARQNAWHSRQLTHSTGRSSPWKYDGLLPITLFHCACVTGYFPIQKPCVNFTRRCVSS